MATIDRLDEFTFQARLAAAAGVSLVLFGRAGCGACRQAARLLGALPAGCVHHRFSVDVEIATALARQFEVFHLPALFLFCDGHYHALLHAPLDMPALLQEIRRAQNAPAEDEP